MFPSRGQGPDTTMKILLCSTDWRHFRFPFPHHAHYLSRLSLLCIMEAAKCTLLLSSIRNMAFLVQQRPEWAFKGRRGTERNSESSNSSRKCWRASFVLSPASVLASYSICTASNSFHISLDPCFTFPVSPSYSACFPSTLFRLILVSPGGYRRPSVRAIYKMRQQECLFEVVRHLKLMIRPQVNR